MDTFEWSPLFETGLPVVDQQHRQLVDLVNQLGRDTDSGNPEQIDKTLDALTRYTLYHFQSEEKIMEYEGVAAAHVNAHRDTHNRFIKQVESWLEQRSQNQEVSLHNLLQALVNWLIFHILGDDQSFARQVMAIRHGTLPQAALAQDHASEDPRTDILLDALRRLYSGLEERNQELLASQHSLSTLNATLEQRVAERTAQLAEVNRMEALGSLAGGIAHEINTPTQYVRDNLSFIKDSLNGLLDFAAASQTMIAAGQWDKDQLTAKLEELELDYLTTELPAAADQAIQGIDRISKIVQAIKEYCYPTSKTPSLIDVNHLIEMVSTVTRNQWKYVGELVFQLEDNLPPITAIEGEINQVLVNLIVNAAQAIGEKHESQPGSIIIGTKASQNGVELSVKDTGCGIKPENIDHIFQMFFTTKPPGQGTGQGLAITEAIIHRHGGKISVTSELGRGSTFTVWLPCKANDLPA